MKRIALVLAIAAAVVGYNTASAFAVTPGWECVPTSAGQAVVSGGTGSAPSCGAGTTAVLAPTYVSSGVGGVPTVQFSSVNVQIVSGSGSTGGTVNGEGNLVVGYAENSGSLSRTGSNNLILGRNGGWTGFGSMIGGLGNMDSADYGAVFGQSNTLTGNFSVAAGGEFNVAKTPWSFIGGGCDNLAGTGKLPKTTCDKNGGGALLGGHSNQTTGSFASVSGGQFNRASDLFASITGGCQNVAGPGLPLNGLCLNGAEAVLGGFKNAATGLESTVAGGEVNSASGGAASVAGGQFNGANGGGSSVAGGDENTASGSFASILGGFFNTATAFDATVSGGENNNSTTNGSSILGGDGNTASSFNCQAIPAAPGTC
jgi:hypothetical protein